MAFISGKWLWNDEIAIPQESFSVDVQFTLLGIAKCNNIFTRVNINSDGSGTASLCCIAESIEGQSLPNNLWQELAVKISPYAEVLVFDAKELRLMDFGTTKQLIDDAFYNYLIVNAVPQTSGEEEDSTTPALPIHPDRNYLIKTATLQAIGDTVRRIKQDTQPVQLSTLPQLVEEIVNCGYEQGRLDGEYGQGKADGEEEVWNRYWDTIQVYGTRTDYRWLFTETRWDRPFFSKYSLSGAKQAQGLFAYVKAGDNLYTDAVDISNSEYSAELFRESDITKVKRIDLRRCVMNDDGVNSGAGSVFYECTSLVTIEELYPPETEGVHMGGCFDLCYALENVNFCSEIKSDKISLRFSDKLSRQSIENIIYHLSPSTSGLTITFSKKAVDKAFETYTDAKNGTTSPTWVNNLSELHPNWTIALYGS